MNFQIEILNLRVLRDKKLKVVSRLSYLKLRLSIDHGTKI